jgi:hypothetical protein
MKGAMVYQNRGVTENISGFFKKRKRETQKWFNIVDVVVDDHDGFVFGGDQKKIISFFLPFDLTRL